MIIIFDLGLTKITVKDIEDSVATRYHFASSERCSLFGYFDETAKEAYIQCEYSCAAMYGV